MSDIMLTISVERIVDNLVTKWFCKGKVLTWKVWQASVHCPESEMY